MKRPSSNTLVGIAGEYFVCAEICMRGFLALLTPKNNPLFDIVATSIDGSHSVSIQVKTRSVINKQGWKFGTDITESDNRDDLFVILVDLHENKLPDYYIYEFNNLSKKVQAVYNNYIQTPRRNGDPRKEVRFRWLPASKNDQDHMKKMNNWTPITNNLQ